MEDGEQPVEEHGSRRVQACIEGILIGSWLEVLSIMSRTEVPDYESNWENLRDD